MKRKDSKGRSLLDGESQRPDGSYRYTYIGNDDKRHDVYSWRLVPKDKQPADKKSKPPLRELESQINKNLMDGISTQKITLNAMFDRFIELKFGVRESTVVGYKELYDRYIRNEYGKRDIGKFKKSDIKTIYMKFAKEQGLSGGTIKKIDCILNQVFNMALDDEMIRKNPCKGVIKEISQSDKLKKKKRKALTAEQQNNLLWFIANSEVYKKWLPIILFMLGTGVRVGEATGLLWKNIDFEENIIHIDHSLSSVGTEFVMSSTKTDSGIRDIPMFDSVRDVLLNLKEEYGDVDPDSFVFVNKHGHFINRNWLNQILKRIVRDYNSTQTDPDKYLPESLSTHILRHSFITRMFENDVSAKLTQSIVGHSKVSTTLDIYTDVFAEKQKSIFADLNKKKIV